MSVKEILHSSYILQEGFRIGIDGPESYCDSKAARDISFTEAPPNARKHIGTKYFRIHQANEENLIEVKEISAEKNTTDLFTESLDMIKFERCRNSILHSPV
eukprot:snap_masked-scaffold_112-processed-gene-0.6-mRNA-1 protein AED:1.00 eAED:1.00 QI:0/-1/0/0/-1/1/1/0/101